MELRDDVDSACRDDEEQQELTGARRSLFLLSRVYTGSQGHRLESFCARPESSLLILFTGFIYIIYLFIYLFIYFSDFHL